MKTEKDTVKALKEQLLTHQYDVEVLDEELSELQAENLTAVNRNTELISENARKQARIVELIQENDRLTNAYEPYHPRRSFHRTPLGWWRLVRNHQAKYAADICFDLYPLSDWVRLSYKGFKPGRYAQLVVGPIRAEFYQQ